MFTINQSHREQPFGTLAANSIIVLFNGKSALMAENGGRLPTAAELAGTMDAQTTMMVAGTIDGAECWGARMSKDFSAPSGFGLVESRLAFVHPNPDLANAISRCREFISWRDGHRLCGACGAKTKFAESDLAIVCPACGMMYYPQIAPAVITMITRNNGKEILLAHNKRFSTPSFSLIAGFVESGESLEQAVAREILEETGVTVKNIRYLSSQPWPFPNSLMLGFMAEYDSGEAFPQDGELSEMGWYSKENLPLLPSPGSIARKIINNYFGLSN